jgi:hypothetical protein
LRWAAAALDLRADRVGGAATLRASAANVCGYASVSNNRSSSAGVSHAAIGHILGIGSQDDVRMRFQQIGDLEQRRVFSVGRAGRQLAACHTLPAHIFSMSPSVQRS